jgi:hypothetical protein
VSTAGNATLEPEAVLDLVPTPNEAVRAERRGGALVLWVPLERPWWTRGALRLLLPLREARGFELDALGEEVWSSCDGERTLERIIEDFAARHRIRFHEGRVAVLTFLRSLVERRLIALVGKRPAAPLSPPAAGPGVAP